MTTVLQFLRGTRAKVDAYAGHAAEPVFDTTKNTLVLMSGTAGENYRLAREDVTITAGDGVTLKVNNTAVETTTLANNFSVSADLSSIGTDLVDTSDTSNLLSVDESTGKLTTTVAASYNAATGAFSFGPDAEHLTVIATIPSSVTGLNTAELVEASAASPITIGEDTYTSGKFLHFNYSLATGSTTDVYVNVTDLVDVYTAGNGLALSNNQFSVVAADGSITSTASGIAVNLATGESILAKDATTNALYIDTSELQASITAVSANSGNILTTGTDNGALLTSVVSTDSGNVLSTGTDGKAFLSSLDLGTLS